MKILIVDDDELSLAITEKVLKSTGYQTFLAEDGEQALEILRNEDIQIVISDWDMPVMDGLELCKILRSNPAVGYIYFIMITAKSRKEDMLVGLGAGVDDFISKPMEPSELILRVRNGERILSLETTAVTLFSLAKLAESKDTDTGNHLERIRVYSRLLATQLMLNPAISQTVAPKFPDLLYQTSPLHDIGKVGIPDYVLLKPGSLNDKEWAIMKRHTIIGAETLNAALTQFPHAEFLRLARDIAQGHHERWDGTGYPSGLKGDQISLSARIVAVADVYDALTMKRVYKSAILHDVACGIILESAGTHFDPQVIEAFQAVNDSFLEVKQHFMD